MDTIDIITTQNVVIQYALAPVRDRIFSFIIDQVVLFISLFLLLLLFSTILSGHAMNYIWYFFSLFFILYSLLSEIILSGQSVGKKLMGLQIVKITGSEATLSDYFIRWAFRFLDIWFSLGSIATVLISSSERHQRLGDLLANTTVIKLNPWSSISLNEILSIHSLDTYKPIYPDVRRFAEADALFIKQALERFRRFNNDAHREALDELSNKVAQQLNLEKIPPNRMEFLKTVLNDYVVLSRS